MKFDRLGIWIDICVRFEGAFWYFLFLSLPFKTAKFSSNVIPLKRTLSNHASETVLIIFHYSIEHTAVQIILCFLPFPSIGSWALLILPLMDLSDVVFLSDQSMNTLLSTASTFHLSINTTVWHSFSFSLFSVIGWCWTLT